MDVSALYGASGTGKSTSALLFAYENNIDAIVDDGLLIYKGQKVAGTSAKYEKNYITAVKRATFFYNDEHKQEIKELLRTLPIQKILIIGTSIKMVELIASRLEINPIDHYIDIEEIRSSNQIKMALFVRKTQGKHVIPIPYVQVEKNVLKKIIQKGIRILSPKKEVIGETTIIHPNFQIGSILISPDVLKKIVAQGCQSIPEVDNCSHIKVDLENLPCVSLQLSMNLDNQTQVVDIVKQIQKKINQDFQQYLNIELYSVDIYLKKVSFNTEHEATQ